MTEQFQVVKLRKRKPLIGKRKSADIKTVNRVLVRAEAFILRIDPCTEQELILAYVKGQFKNASRVFCEKLQTKFDSYCFFKVTHDNITFQNSLNMNNWPEGIIVKRFYANKQNQKHYRNPTMKKSHRMDSAMSLFP